MANIMAYISDSNHADKMISSLTKAKHNCTCVNSAEESMALIEEKTVDLCIISVKLSWSSLSGLLDRLQQNNYPVVFIDCNQANVKHLKKMYHGNCEVLGENFSGLRLSIMINRLLEKKRHILTHGNIVMDTDSKIVTVNGGTLALTSQEFSLLQVLMESPNEAVSRDELLRVAWGYKAAGITRTVDVHIQRLRKKMGNACIETVYRTGYRLAVN